MNIIVAHGFEPNYTLGFIKGLAANGVKVCVVSSDVDHQRLTACGLPGVNLRGSADARRPALGKLTNLLTYYARLLLFVCQNRKATVHFTGIFRKEFILFEGVVLGLCFKWCSSRYIYTAHNILPHGKDQSRFFRCIYRFIYSLPDIIVVHTQSGKRQLINQFSVPAEKIQVISIGLNEEIPDTELTPVAARQKLGYQQREKVILFFGKMDEYKGVDLLLQAFEQLESEDARLLIAGSFRNPAYREKILLAVRSSSKASAICLREENVPNQEVEVLLKGADVLCMPYRNIYQSGVLFLALRFGIPIVATNVGSLPEFVDAQSGIVAESIDAAGVAAALRRFIGSQTLFDRQAIRDNSRKYQWNNICKPLVPLYSR